MMASIGSIGCSDQYADYGTIDMAASKEAAENSGLKKFEAKLKKKKRPTRGPVVTDDKFMALPPRSSRPR